MSEEIQIDTRINKDGLVSKSYGGKGHPYRVMVCRVCRLALGECHTTLHFESQPRALRGIDEESHLATSSCRRAIAGDSLINAHARNLQGFRL
jgi:hypothetical protein